MMRKVIMTLLFSASMWGETLDTKAPAPFWTEDSVHKVLGIATVGSAALTAILRPQYEGETVEGFALHRNLAYVTAGLAGATILTGVWLHWDDVGLEYSATDYDNLHAILATVGGGMMIAAAVIGNNSMAHSTLGIGGAALMGSAIVLEW